MSSYSEMSEEELDLWYWIKGGIIELENYLANYARFADFLNEREKEND